MPALKYYEGGVWKTLPIGSVSGSGGGGHTVQDETNALTQRTKLNFVGQGVTVTDESTLDTTRVSIPAGAQAYAYGGGALVGVPTTTFTVCPISTTNLVISSSSGVPDFERMSDGSLRIVNEGFYEITGSINASDPINDANQVEVRIYSLTAGGAARWETISNTYTGVAGYPTLPLARGTYLSAGTRISFHVYHTQSNSRQFSLYDFSIHRTGQGPPGPQAAVPMEAWHTVGAAGEPAFQNGWTAQPSVQYQKDPLGHVSLRGVAGAGVTTPSTTIFTLPVGYRPLAETFCTVISNGVPAQMRVQPGGAVTINSGSGYITFDNIEFDTGTVTAMPTGPAGPKGDPGPTGPTGSNATIPMDPWHYIGATGEPTFTSPFVHYDTNTGSPTGGSNLWQSVGFRKDPLGRVYLKGLLGASGPATSGQTIFQLPVGYRPLSRVVMLETSIGDTGGARLDINASNGFVVYNTSNPTVIAGSFITLDGLSFDTESVTAMPSGPKGDTGATGAKGADGVVADPAYRKSYNIGAAAQSGVSNTTPWVYNTANSPYVDLTPGTWRIEAGAMMQGNVADFVVLSLWNETDNVAISLSAADSFYVGTSAQVPLTNVHGNHMLTVTKNTRVRIWVIPAGASVQTILAAPANMATAYMEAWLVGPGLKGDKGDTGAKGADGVAASVPMDPWHTVNAAGEPAWGSAGWSHSPGGTPLRFRKDPMGRVWIRGDVSGGTSGSALFTLPNGYKPPFGQTLANLQSSDAAGTWIVISTGGVVAVTYAGVAAYVDVSFDTETVTALPTGPQGAKGDTGATGGNATVPMDTWHKIGGAGEPAFLNQWINYDNSAAVPSTGPTDRNARFHKDPLGVVSLMGVVKSSTPANAVAFTLPASYWPKTGTTFTTICQTGLTQITIGTNGVVQISGATTGALPGTYTFLDGIEFDTETVTAMPTGPKGDKGDVGGNATVPIDKWHKVGAVGEPAFTGWAGSDLYFRKDPLGRVYIYGNTGGGPATTAIFQLPAGYTPKFTRYFDTLRSAGTAGGYVTIDPSGFVSAATIDNYVDLSFDTETVTAMPTGPKGDKGDPGASTSIALVATLPAAPYDGLEVYYLADATNGIIWHLRYRSASTSAYKWEYLGGPPLRSYISGQDAITSTSFVNAPTNPGPAIALPLIGDYDVEWNGQIIAPSGNFLTFSPLGNDEYGAISTAPNSTAARKIRASAISGTITLTYRVSGGTGYALRREMLITPARVG